MRVDDSLDVFAEHAIGGVVGLIGNAIFAADYIVSLDGVTTTVRGLSLFIHFRSGLNPCSIKNQ